MIATRLTIDNRYAGNHGIARYAREVVPRLDLEWEPLAGRYRPGSPRDVADPHRMALSRDVLLYNPGYTAGPSRARQLLTVHDLIHLRDAGRDPRARLVRAYYERVVKPTIRRCGHVLTVSQTSADELRRWLGDDDVEVHNAGNGCSTVFSPEGDRFDPGGPYVLYVGNLKPHKNPRLAFEAMAELPDLRLVVVTDDRAAATRLGLGVGISDRVLVRTGVGDAELASLYRGALALAFPSIVEGFGLPAAEALQCGTSVVHLAECLAVDEICEGLHAVSAAGGSHAFAAELAVASMASRRQGATARFDWATVAVDVARVIEKVRDE